MENEVLQEIRTFNRFFAVKLNIFNRYVLGTSYSLVEGRIIGEIGRNKNCTAQQIASELNMDKSYLSRILASLEKNNLIKRSTSKTDGREKQLTLTKNGDKLFEELELLSNKQVKQLLKGLGKNKIKQILQNMRSIQNLLNKPQI